MNFLPPDVERQLLENEERNRNRRAVSLQQDQTARAARVVDINRKFPNLPNGAAVAGADAGVPDEILGQMEVDVATDEGLGWFERLGDTVGDAASAVYEQVLKPVVRTAAVVGDGLFDETIGRATRTAVGVAQGRDLGDAFNASGGSALGRMLSDGNPFNDDIGTGFMVGGPVGEDTMRDQSQIQVGGTMVTPGTLLAHGVNGMTQDRFDILEPGRGGFQVLSGLTDLIVNVKLDPASRALDAASSIKAANNDLTNVILKGSTRNTVDLPAAVQALSTNSRARRASEWIAGEQSATRIWELSGRNLPIELADDLSRLGTSEEVVRRLADAAVQGPISGLTDLRQFGQGPLAPLGRRRREYLGRSRILQQMPGSSYNLDDNVEGLFRTFDDTQRNARLPAEVREANNGLWLDALRSGDETLAWEAVTKMAKSVSDFTEEIVTDSNATRRKKAQQYQIIDDSTRLIKKRLKEMEDLVADETVGARGSLDGVRDTAYFIDDEGREVLTDFSRTSKDGLVIPTPVQVSQLFNQRTIPNVDVREIKRLTAKGDTMRALYSSTGWDWSTTALESLISNVWKPFQLLRVAYPARVLPEEQARMAVAGLDSAVNHPLSFFAWRIANNGTPIDMDGLALAFEGKRLAKTRTGVARVKAKTTNKLQEKWGRGGNTILDEGEEGMRDTFALNQSYSEALTTSAPRLEKGAASQQRKHLHSKIWTVTGKDDPAFVPGVRRQIHQQATDPMAIALAQGQDMAEVARRMVDGDLHESAARLARNVEEFAGIESDISVARRYLEQITAPRLQAATGGVPELVDIIATRTVNGVPLRMRRQADKQIDSMVGAKRDALPERVPVERSLIEGFERQDTAVDAIFDVLMTNRTNLLARSPSMRQFYWKNAAEAMPHVSSDVREQIIAQAKKANLDKKAIKELEDWRARPAGPLDDLEAIDEGIAHRAMRQTKELLYDTHKRGQFADTMRIAAPFAEAWVEVMTTWSRLLKENPGTLTRGVRLLDTAEQAGFFNPDPQTGEEMFNYPGGGVLSKILFGDNDSARGTLKGRVNGLNLIATSVGPGFGPVVQWPAAAFLPDSPSFDLARELIIPFGSNVTDKTDLLDMGVLIRDFMPAWAERVVQGVTRGGIDERRWNNVVGDIAAAMITSGQAEVTSLEDLEETLQEAAKKAQWTWILQGAAQFIVPTGPAIDFEVKTTEDAVLASQWFQTGVLADAFRELREHHGDDAAAWQEFAKTYGLEPWWVAQSKSKSLKERPVTRGGDEWLRRNDELIGAFPNVVGFFAPEDDTSEDPDRFDYTAYVRQFETDARVSLTGEQQLRLARRSRAYAIYNNTRNQLDELGIKGSQRERILDAKAEEIEEQYPFWREKVPVPEPESFDVLVDELERAVTDKRLHGNEVADALRLYLQKRNEAIEVRDQRSPGAGSFGESRDADLRRYLNALGQALSTEVDGFGRVWTRVLRREVEA